MSMPPHEHGFYELVGMAVLFFCGAIDSVGSSRLIFLLLLLLLLLLFVRRFFSFCSSFSIFENKITLYRCTVCWLFSQALWYFSPFFICSTTSFFFLYHYFFNGSHSCAVCPLNGRRSKVLSKWVQCTWFCDVNEKLNMRFIYLVSQTHWMSFSK